MKMKKKGQSLGMGTLIAFGVAFVVAVVVLAMGGQTLTSVQSTQTTASAGANITGQGLSGLLQIGNNLSTIAIVGVLVVIIGLIVTVLVVLNRSGVV